MDTYGCGYSEVWNIFSDVSLDYVVISFYYLDYLKVVLCVEVIRTSLVSRRRDGIIRRKMLALEYRFP